MAGIIFEIVIFLIILSILINIDTVVRQSKNSIIIKKTLDDINKMIKQIEKLK